MNADTISFKISTNLTINLIKSSPNLWDYKHTIQSDCGVKVYEIVFTLANKIY